MKNIVKGCFKLTGINEIDIDLVIANWNHLWLVSQWKDEFRIVKYMRKDSKLLGVKITISEVQANELINKLNLKQIKSSAFRSASMWKQQDF